MAERPKGYGFTAELGKNKEKVDERMVASIIEWIASNLGKRPASGQTLQEFLKDGTVLCELLNKINPNSVPQINCSKTVFKDMENIGNFLKALDVIDIAKSDQFETADLYENRNMYKVIACLHVLDRKALKIARLGYVPITPQMESDQSGSSRS